VTAFSQRAYESYLAAMRTGVRNKAERNKADHEKALLRLSNEKPEPDAPLCRDGLSRREIAEENRECAEAVKRLAEIVRARTKQETDANASAALSDRH